MTLYFEQQRFRQKWIMVICWITPFSFFFFAFFSLVGVLQPKSPINYDLTALWVSILSGFTTILIPIFIRNVGLNTRISKQGLSFRFVPFHRHERIYPFETIHSVEAVQYRPVRDYGGWGIRYGRNGKVYNVSGNKGVMINLKDGGSFLIGSQQNELLAQSITNNL